MTPLMRSNGASVWLCSSASTASAGRGTPLHSVDVAVRVEQLHLVWVGREGLVLGGLEHERQQGVAHALSGWSGRVVLGVRVGEVADEQRPSWLPWSSRYGTGSGPVLRQRRAQRGPARAPGRRRRRLGETVAASAFSSQRVAATDEEARRPGPIVAPAGGMSRQRRASPVRGPGSISSERQPASAGSAPAPAPAAAAPSARR